MTDALPAVGVFFDVGAASAREINEAARGLCRPLLLCDFSLPAVARQAALLKATAALVDITSLSATEVVAALAHYEIGHVTTFSESQLTRASTASDIAGLSYHAPDTVRMCTDKRAQRAALRTSGVSSVRQATVATSADLRRAVADVGLPAVVKPTRGVGSRDTYFIASSDDVEALCQSWPAASDGVFVLESFLEGDPTVAGAAWGDYVSVEAVSRHGEFQPICVTGKMPFASSFRETGIVVPSTLDEPIQQQCIALARRAVEALGFKRGVSHTELKLTSEGPEVIEVNARVGGYVPPLLKRAAGFDLIRTELLAMLDVPFDLPPLSFASVEYQHFVQPPRGGVLAVAEGFKTLKHLPGVIRVERGLTAGDTIDLSRGTAAFIVAIHGSARTHNEVLDTVRRAHASLKIEFVDD